MESKFFAGGFLYNPATGEVLMHKRDGKAAVNPDKWGVFGGSSEAGEAPLDTFIREMKEELGIDLKPGEVVPLCDYLNEQSRKHRYVFYVESDRKKSDMTLGEGADFDWVPLSEVFQYDLTESTRKDLQIFINLLEQA